MTAMAIYPTSYITTANVEGDQAYEDNHTIISLGSCSAFGP